MQSLEHIFLHCSTYDDIKKQGIKLAISKRFANIKITDAESKKRKDDWSQYVSMIIKNKGLTLFDRSRYWLGHTPPLPASLTADK